MLSQTTKLDKTTYRKSNQDERQREYLLLKAKMKEILKSIEEDQKGVDQYWLQKMQKKQKQLRQRDQVIIELTKKNDRKCRENQQLKYQLSRKTAMIAVMEQQTKQSSKESDLQKAKIKETVQYLLNQNQDLRKLLIKFQKPFIMPTQFLTSCSLNGFGQKNHSHKFSDISQNCSKQEDYNTCLSEIPSLTDLNPQKRWMRSSMSQFFKTKGSDSRVTQQTTTKTSNLFKDSSTSIFYE